MKKENSKKFAKILIFILKIPYYLILLFVYLIKSLIKGVKKLKIKNKRKKMTPKYDEIRVVKKIKGNYNNFFEDLLKSKNKVGLIIGARGSGKTAIGLKLLENIYAKTKRNCYAIGFKEEEIPYWIKTTDEISKIKNDSLVLIDEGGIVFSSRDSMNEKNKILSEMLLISRHKNISIIFISQNSSNIDINTLRQSDFIIFKQPSLLQNELERKIIKNIYSKISKNFNKFKNKKEVSYIYSDKFEGFVSNKLPSFWSEEVSKSFKNNKSKAL